VFYCSKWKDLKELKKEFDAVEFVEGETLAVIIFKRYLKDVIL